MFDQPFVIGVDVGVEQADGQRVNALLAGLHELVMDAVRLRRA